MESIKTTPMLVQYQKIRAEYPDGLLFYRLGDFYELLFDDAITASSVLDITLTKRGKTTSGDDIPLCGVPVDSYEIYVNRLIKHGFKVHICEQLEDPTEAKKRGYKAIINRGVVRTITSGTIMEDQLLEGTKNNYLLCIFEQGKNLSLSWADISIGDFWVQDSNRLELSNIISRIQPSEILIPDSMVNDKVFMEYKHILSTLPQARFDRKNAQSFLQQAFGNNIAGISEFSSTGIIAAGALLDYVMLMQKTPLTNITIPKKFIDSDFVSVDRSTFKNLEIFFDSEGETKGSLFNAINLTRTKQGGRLLRNRLRYILKDDKAIKQRLESVDFFVKNQNLANDLDEALKEMPDFERAMSRLLIERYEFKDLLIILYALKAINKIKDILRNATLPEELKNYELKLVDYNGLLNELDQALIPDASIKLSEGGYIKSGYDAKLDILVTDSNNSLSFMNELRDKYIQELKVPQIKISHNNIIGYFIEVPSKVASSLMDNPEFVHRHTTSTTVRFSTKQLAELEVMLVDLKQKSLTVEKEIFKKLVKLVEEKHEFIRDMALFVSALDVSASGAKLASKLNLVKPEIMKDNEFEIEGGWHIVVANFLQRSNTDFISNDCKLSGGIISIITAPNMSGKSTFLRQNALIVILGQIGYFVPATKAIIGIADGIFSRIGAGDNLAKGQSTFMVEMMETAYIMNYATSKSLIILDELGRGTATFDGMAIAGAVLEYIHNKIKARTLFATHYRELTSLANKYSNIKCLTMKTIEAGGGITFLHKVEYGVSEKSYGIHVGVLAGLPNFIVSRAKLLLDELEEGKHSASNNLPLFNIKNAVDSAMSEDISGDYINIIEELKSINMDDKSPRQAAEILSCLVNKARKS